MLLYRANSNIITATCWYIIELAKNPRFLSTIRAEANASSSLSNGSRIKIDAKALSAQPFIQSGYAEILRLHTYNFLLNSSEHDDFNFREWKIPKNQIMAVSSHTAHMDFRVWNTGPLAGEHPLDTFWPERFLVYEPELWAGPLKPEYSQRQKVKKP